MVVDSKGNVKSNTKWYKSSSLTLRILNEFKAEVKSQKTFFCLFVCFMDLT